jgi:hypothetical protein
MAIVEVKAVVEVVRVRQDQDDGQHDGMMAQLFPEVKPCRPIAASGLRGARLPGPKPDP